jgi:Xaa-Pro aminopeptidase
MQIVIQAMSICRYFRYNINSMIDKNLTSDFFANNRRRLHNEADSKLIIITANGLLQKSLDAAFPFKQDTSFWYLTGISTPDVILVITEDSEFLIVPSLNNMRKVFDGSIDVDGLQKVSGIDHVVDEKEGWSLVKKIATKNKKVATLLPAPSRLKHYDFYTQPARRVLVTKIKRIIENLVVEDLRPLLSDMRAIKQPVEIMLIQKAIDITNQTLSAALAGNKLDKFNHSYEIEAAISLGFRSRGANGHGFEPIVASGKSATILHYHEHDQKLRKGELIVVDVGSDYSFYMADISRTISYGESSARQIQVFEAVKYVQTEAFKLIKAGVLIKDFEKQVETLIGEQLIDLGVIKKLDHKEIRRYYPHSCSHSLGIDPHDVYDYSKPLKPNMVMTVEPGIYLPDEAIGVRLEDDVLIQQGQSVVMSKSLPTTLDLL